jgi:tRNA G18 (ribose-2'-O)-methylase SpoU
VVQRALDAGCLPVSPLVEDRHVKGEAAGVIAECGRMSGEIPVYTGRYEDLTRLTGYALTRGVLCAMKRPMLRTVEQVLQTAEAAAEKGAARIAVLENVMNPTNIGAIFRSAAALGMDALLLTPACCDPLYRRSVRVSMGTVFQIPWTYIGSSPADWPEEGMHRLSNMGFATAAMALRDDSVSIDDPHLLGEKKLAVILGTEGDGLADTTIASCDYTVRIPMSHGVDSLNVAAASAVAFWVLSR